MGVPGFSTWLKRRYPDAFKDITKRQSFDHVYVDLPSTLHIVTRKARSKHGLHHLLYRRLDQLLLASAPRKRVVLALDGPAPLAKLLEQRRRRRREAERLIRAAAGQESESAASQARSGRKERDQALTSLSLTTGTVLMLELHHSLAYYICRRLANPRYQHLKFELSDSTVKGEGELKILSRLLPGGGTSGGGGPADTSSSSSTAAGSNTSDVVEPGSGNTTRAGRSSGAHETHLVVGGDSDLLLMGMISGQRGLVICDEAHEMGARREGPLAFSRDTLEAVWRRDHLGPDATEDDVTSFALDLTLLAIMSHSNDYLPGCPGLQLSNKQRPGLWNHYLSVRRQGRWAGQWLVNRPRNASERGPAEGEEGVTVVPVPVPGVELNLPMLTALLGQYQDPRGAAQQAAAPSEDESEEGSSLEEDGLPTTSSRFLGHRPADPGAYLAGLEWVLGMYSTGAVNDYRFTYFGGPPTPAELVAQMKAQMGEEAAGGAQRSADVTAAAAAAAGGGSSSSNSPVGGALVRPRSREPLTPAACALALLPARGRAHAATALRHLMDADSPVAEIYAVCHECRANGDRIKAVSREFATVRKELAAVQAKLTAASLDADGAVDVAGDLLGAAERCEDAQQKLRRLLADLSRSQQDHQLRSHPPRPFPTAELEAAVNAIPVECYPKRERRLARFGRETVFAWLPEDAAGAAAGEAAESDGLAAAMAHQQQQGGGGGVPCQNPAPSPSPNGGRPRPYYAGKGRGNGGNFQFNPGYTPNWLRDCMSFASAYPRLAEPDYLRIAAVRVSREVLPVRPYMQLAADKAAPVATLWRPSGSHHREVHPGAALPSRHLRRITSSAGGGCRAAAAAGYCALPLMTSAPVGPAARPARANLVSCAAKLLPRLRMVRF